MEAGCTSAPPGGFDPSASAEFHFRGARLFDKRRTDRLVRTARRIMSHPGGTLPQRLVGPAPRGKQGERGRLWVDVCDRGSDTFEFLRHEVENGRHFVVRCAKDRNLLGEDHVGADRVYQKMYAYVRGLPTLGERVVEA